MSLYKRGNIWWIAVTKDGKRHFFSTKTSDKKKAQEIYAKVLLRLSGTDAENPTKKVENRLPQSNITFAEFFKNHYLPWCYGRYEDYRIKKYYLNILPEHFKQLKLYQISIVEIEKLQTHWISKEYSKATSNKYLAILKASLAKAYEWDMITEEILKSLKKVKPLRGETKRLRYLTEDEIIKLLDNCESYLYPIVFVALNTGMRKSEILNFTWDNVDLKNGLILLEKTKNGERREIPMNEPLKQLFRQLFIKRRLDTEYVFVNPETGKRYIDLKRSFATACKKSGIRDFHFHDLRHTFASQLVMNGVDLKTVQELLGHKDIKMTLRYSHLSQAHKKEAVNKITGFLKIPRKQEKI